MTETAGNAALSVCYYRDRYGGLWGAQRPSENDRQRKRGYRKRLFQWVFPIWTSLFYQECRSPCLRSAARRCDAGFGLRWGRERRTSAPPSAEKADWVHRRAQLPSFSPRTQSPGCSCCRCHWRRSQRGNSLHDLREQRSWDRNLGHLKRDVAPVADDLRTDLDQLLEQTRKRPLFNHFGYRERA